MTVFGIRQTSGTRIDARLNIEVGGEWPLRLRIASHNLAPGLQHSRSLLSQVESTDLVGVLTWEVGEGASVAFSLGNYSSQSKRTVMFFQTVSLIKLQHEYINFQSFKITLDAGVLTVIWNPITQVERIVISRPGTE